MKTADIGLNEADSADSSLYLTLYKEEKKGEFNVSKAGNYFYLNTKILYDHLKIDYVTNYISFDIDVIDNDGETIYKLKQKTTERKAEKEESDLISDLL